MFTTHGGDGVGGAEVAQKVFGGSKGVDVKDVDYAVVFGNHLGR